MCSRIKQNVAPRLCAILPPPVWHKLLSINLVIPHWHIISDDLQPHISGLYKYRNIVQFRADIDYFLKYYEPVSLIDILNYLENGVQLPKRCFLPTFDDGFREIYEIAAPMLYEKGVPAAFFLTTSVIDNQILSYPQKKSIIINRIKDINDRTIETEVKKTLDNYGIPGNKLSSRIQNIYYLQSHVLDQVGNILNCDFAEYVHKIQPYLSTDQIKTLIKKGFAIGAHSIDHPLYSELSIEQQLNQTLGSIQQLSKLFTYSCNAFAFPYGDADISQEFFQRAFANEQLKVTFGIGNVLFNNKSFRNLPRFSMERTDIPAEHILARQFGRALLGNIKTNNLRCNQF